MSTPEPRKKSPRAPSFSLEEAIDRVQKVYDRERLHPAPTEVVAQHLGYKGASNGAALSALASVRYFGLVDRPREGILSVTKDFENFKFAPDERQRQTLLLAFLRKPALYAELLDKYETGLPSDPTLRFELIQRGFSPASAEAALTAFRRSVDYVGFYTNGNQLGADPSQAPGIGDADQMIVVAPVSAGRAQQSVRPAAVDLTLAPSSADEEMDRIPVRLPGGRRAWLLIPIPFFSSDKARLKAQIDLLLSQDEEEI